MTAMRRLAVSTLIFVAAAFVGPLIGWLMWPPYKFEQSQSLSVENFVRDLVFLIWPTGPLAVIEVNTGPLVAAVIAVGANVLLFAFVGVLVGAVAKHGFGLLALYISVCALVLLLALWGAGFNFAYINVLALVVALSLYAVPFWATDHFAGRNNPGSE